VQHLDPQALQRAVGQLGATSSTAAAGGAAVAVRRRRRGRLALLGSSP
jgi:hypothetical protein